MPLFKSSNKSQASLDRLTGSRDHSPTQPPNSAYTHPQAYGGPSTTYSSPQYQQPQQQQQHQQQQQQQHSLQHPHQHQPPSRDPESYYTGVTTQPQQQSQQHPSHILNRTQSSRVGSGAGDSYAQDQQAQPTVNIVPPATHPVQQSQQSHYAPAQVPYNQQPPPRTEKEHKKPKRGLIGLLSKKEREEDPNDRRSLARAPSILKKGGPQSPNPLQTSPKPNSSHFSDTRQGGVAERFSTDSLPQEPGQYNQYREPQDPYRQLDQFDSPQSQHTRQSVQYVEDSRYQPQHPSQQNLVTHDRQLPIYQHPHSANNSDSNLPYPGTRTSASAYDSIQSLRPPSQTSLGPPSPLVSQQIHDSRPSTSNTQQQRFSAQSQQPQQLQHVISPPTSQQQRDDRPQQLQLQLQQPQPQHHHQQQQQQNSLPPSQQPTPQPTPQPQILQSQQLQQQQQTQAPPPIAPVQVQSAAATTNMPRNEASNGRRHEDNAYSQQDPRARAQGHEQATQGRNTPPPARRGDDLSSLDYAQLLAKHEELQAKYSKVKRYYFEREAQVTQLQNTVANQRLSMSKTSLDDAGYITRFDRLNGAIQNLSFNIRKEWRRIPNWLAPVCNRDAHNVGTKEMTAVGRACITRWLYESIFERVFHPGIDPTLSVHLKAIERTLRRSQYNTPLTFEQQDDVMTKITTWRLTTIEGLQDVLASRQCPIYTETLTMEFAKQLELYLRAFLVDPPPAGLMDSLGAIVSQAVGIAQNIPLESRDIRIEYFTPGSYINETYMRLESGMTMLTNPGSAPSPSDALPMGADNEDQSSISSSQMDQGLNVEDAIRESAKAASAPGQGQRNESVTSSSTSGPKLAQSASTSSKEKKGFLGGFVSKKPSQVPPSSRQEPDQAKMTDNGAPEHAYNWQSLTGGITDNKIRFAVFLTVEVRGRGVLRENGKDGKDGSGSSKDIDDKKDGATSAGAGAMTGGNSGSGQKSGNSANILCKAPVYAFE